MKNPWEVEDQVKTSNPWEAQTSERDPWDYGGADDDWRSELASRRPQSTEPQYESEDTSFVRDVADVGVGFVGAVPKAAGSLVSLGSLVPGVHYVADPLSSGLNSVGEWVDNTFLSDRQLEINKELQTRLQAAAEELGPDASIGDYIDNMVAQGGEAGAFIADHPGQVTNLIAQSLPYVFGGGVAAKGLKAGAKVVGAEKVANMGAKTSGAVGEGLITAGAVEGEIVRTNEQKGEDGYSLDRLAAVPAGVTTGLISRGGAQFSPVDIDTVAAKVAAGETADLMQEAAKQGFVKRTVKGAALEGVEETLQSGQEKVFTNIGTDEHPLKDVGGDAVIGGITGAGQGAGVNALAGLKQNSETNEDLVVRPDTETLLEEAQLTIPRNEDGSMPNIELPEVTPEGASTGLFVIMNGEQVDLAALQANRDALLVAHSTATPEQQAQIEEIVNQVAAIEQQMGAAQQVRDQELAAAAQQEEAKKDLRLKHADTFPDEAEFVNELKKEAQATRDAELDDPTTEIGAAFQQWRKDNNNYDTKNNSAAAKKQFLKDAGIQEGEVDFKGDYLAALDAHAEMKEVQANRNPQSQARIDREKAELVAELNEAVKSGDPAAIAAVEQKAINAGLMPAEWAEAKRTLTKGLNANKKTPKTNTNATPATPAAPATNLENTETPAPKTPKVSKVKADAIKRATEALGDNWQEEHPELSQLLDNGGLYKKDKNGVRRFDKFLNQAVEEKKAKDAEAQAEKDKINSMSDADIEMRNAAEEYATEKLGDNWVETYPDLNKVLDEGNYGLFNREVDAAADNAANATDSEIVSQKANTLANKENIKLAKTEQKIYDFLLERAKQGNLSDYVNADGSFNATAIAKDAGLKSKGVATTGRTRIKKKIAEALGMTEEQLTEGLSQTKRGNTQEFEDNRGDAPSVGTTVSENEIFGDDQTQSTMSEISSVGGSQSNIGDLTKEEKEYVDEQAISKPDPVQQQRQKDAQERLEKQIDAVLASPLAQEALNMWNNMKSDGAVSADQLSKQDAYDWIMTVAEVDAGYIDMKQLDKDQRDMERRYDANEVLTDETNQDAGQIESQKVLEGPSQDAQGTDGTRGTIDTEAAGDSAEVQLTAAEQKERASKVKVSTKKKRKFSVKNLFGGKGKKSVTRTAFMRELADITGKKAPWRVTVFDTTAEAIAARITDEDIGTIRPQGWVVPDSNGLDRAYFILENIKEGNERAVIMHEIGSHMGLDNLLTEEQVDIAVGKIMEWSELDDGSDASLYAKAARVRAAEAAPHMENPETDYPSELIAYFIEEAVNDGVDVTKSDGTALGDFIRKMWAAFKSAYRKFRGDNVDTLTPQDFVNLAYGAARLENSTTFHGTATWFRKFNHDFMGTGEGAQAFGWGTYLAERFGIGNEYRQADVSRKNNKTGSLFHFPKIFEALRGYSHSKNIGAKADHRTHDVKSQLIKDSIAAENKGVLKDVYIQRNDEDGNPKLIKVKIAPGAKVFNRGGYVLVQALVAGEDNSFQSKSSFLVQELVDKDGNSLLSEDEAFESYLAGMLELTDGTFGTTGQLYRVDYAFADEEMLDWDERVEDQPLVLKAINNMPDEIVDALMEDLATDEEFTGVTGELLYFSLSNLQFHDYMLEEYVPQKDYDQAQKAGSRVGPGTKGQAVTAKAIASAFLYQYGIKGIKFLDNTSRKKARRVVDDNQDTLVNDVPQLLDIVNDSTPYLKEKGARVLYYKKADGTVESLLVSTKSAVSYRTTSDGEARPVRIASSVDGVSIPLKELYTDQNATIPLEFDEAQIRADIDEAKKYKADGFTRNKVIFNDKDVIRVANNPGSKMGPGNIRFSVGKKSKQVAKTLMGSFGEMTVDNFAALAKTAVKELKFLHSFIRDVRDRMPSADKWYNFILESEKTRNEILQKVENIAVQAREMGDQQMKEVNKFIADSTLYQKWGYQPSWITDPNFKADPIMERRWKKLNADQRKVVEQVFQHGEDMRQLKADLAKKMGLTKLFGKSEMQGPYAPLKRFGDYVVVLKSDQLKAAEDALKKDNSKANRDAVEKLKAQQIHYVVKFFDTMGSANQFRDANLANYPASPEARTRDQNEDMRGLQGAEVLSKAIGQLTAVDGLDPKAKDAFKKLLEEMYFQTMQERDARQSGRKRMSYAGFEENMIRSFLSHAHSEANMIAHMTHGAEINSALAEAKKEARESGSEELNLIHQKMVTHYVKNMTPRTGLWKSIEDRATAVTTVWMLTSSVGYHIQNATQTMIALGKLVEIASAPATYKALGRGYAQARNVVSYDFKNLQTVVDVAKADPKYRKLLEELNLRQLLDVGIEQDLNEFDSKDWGNKTVNKIGDGMSKTAHRLYQIARMVEGYNRVSSAVAAYDLAQRNAGKVNRLYGMTPQEYAVMVVEDTQGNFSGIDAPLAFKRTSKIITQFRKYQVMMAWFYVDAAKKVLKGATPEERIAAARVLGFSTTYAALVSGAVGMPAMGLFAPIFFALIGAGDDDEEPKDLERWIRDNVEDETLATIISRGLPAAIGLDMSTKLSQAKIFDPLPYTDYELSEEGAGDIVVDLITGPFGSVVKSGLRGKKYAEEGDYYRAIENISPKGLRSMMESYRYSTEGYKLSNGDIVADPSMFDFKDLLINGLGLQPTDLNVLKWKYGQQYELTQWFTEEQSKITKAYVRAEKAEDYDEMDKLEEKWEALQESKDRVRPFFNDSYGALKYSRLRNLTRAPYRAEKRASKTREKLGTD